MRTRAIVIVAGIAALVSASAAHADMTKKNAKFCSSLGDFQSHVTALRTMGPDSSIAALRTASERVEADAQKVVKAAGKLKTPAAKQFTDSARQLRLDASQVPSNITVQQAQSRIAGDVSNVERAARQLATEAGCPDVVPPSTTSTR